MWLSKRTGPMKHFVCKLSKIFTFKNVYFNRFGFRIWRTALEYAVVRFINFLNDQRTDSDSWTPMLVKDQTNITLVVSFRPFWHINQLKYNKSFNLLMSSKQPNLRIPNPQYFVYLLDQTVGRDFLQFIYWNHATFSNSF